MAQVVTTTSGREERGIPPRRTRLVGGALGAFHDRRVVHEHDLDVRRGVSDSRRRRAARRVRGPRASCTAARAGRGRVHRAARRQARRAELAQDRVGRLGAELVEEARRALAVDHRGRSPDREAAANRVDAAVRRGRRSRTRAAIRVSTAAIRALFRSKQLAELWHEYLNTTVDRAAAPRWRRRRKEPAVATQKLKAMRAADRSADQVATAGRGSPKSTRTARRPLVRHAPDESSDGADDDVERVRWLSVARRLLCGRVWRAAARACCAQRACRSTGR